MSATGAIILIVVGAAMLILKGILNIGNNFGRSKRFIEMIGQGPARIIYSVIGLGLTVLGILAYINPQIFG